MVSFPKISFPGFKLREKKIPMHFTVNTGLMSVWANEKKKTVEEGFALQTEKIDFLIDYQIKNEIRVLTIKIDDNSKESLAFMKKFFSKLVEDERVSKNQLRIFITGQWYELDSDLTDTLKLCMEKTSDFDNLFLNFCINYDGQEEILGAMRLLTRKILAEKISEEELSKDMVKENIYSSYFPPPELIIETTTQYTGTMLWDSLGSVIFYSQNAWPDFDKKDLDEAIDFYARIADR